MDRATKRRMQAAKRKREVAERKRVHQAKREARLKIIPVRLPHGNDPQWYQEYLRSTHWSAFKKRYVESGRPCMCVVCSDPRYELHHRTYERIGAERLDDVVALCRAHHARAHKNIKWGVPMWDAHLAGQDMQVANASGL